MTDNTGITSALGEVRLKVSLAIDALDLSLRFDGPWGEHPMHSTSSWQQEVDLDETRLGYWEWVAGQNEQAEEDDLDDGLPEMGSEDTHADNGPCSLET